MIKKQKKKLEDILPFPETEESVKKSVEMIINDSALYSGISKRFPMFTKKISTKLTKKFLESELGNINTQNEFTTFLEKLFSYGFNKTSSLGSGIFKYATWLAKKFADFGKLSINGLENIANKDKPYLILFNHEEIIDPLLINYAIYQKRKDLFYGVAGSNLHKFPFMEAILRQNKAFTIHRQCKDSKYKTKGFFNCFTKHLLDGNNMLIANNGGTCKKGTYETDENILKLLSLYLNRNKKTDNAFDEFNIVTCSISYDKNKESFLKRKKYTKTNVYKAITQYFKDKGIEKLKDGDDAWRFLYGAMCFSEASINFSSPLDISSLDYKDTDILKNKIDKSITKNYNLYQDNDIVYDLKKSGVKDIIFDRDEFILSEILRDTKDYLMNNYYKMDSNFIIGNNFWEQKKTARQYFSKKIKPFIKSFHKEYQKLEKNNSKKAELEVLNYFLDIYSNPIKMKQKHKTGKIYKASSF